MSWFTSSVIGSVVGNNSTYISNNSDYVNIVGTSSVNINGKVYTGNNIQIRNNEVYIDGKKSEEGYVDSGSSSTPHCYQVIVNCQNLEKVETVGSVTVNGNCGTVSTTGSVNVEGNSGTIKTTGSVTVAGNCSGSISTMGRVTVGSRY